MARVRSITHRTKPDGAKAPKGRVPLISLQVGRKNVAQG
jgi:hypothetical protein